MTSSVFADPRWSAALDELADVQCQQAALFAAEARVLTDLEARTTRDGWRSSAPYDSLLMEVAGTALIGQQAADRRIEHAVQLVRRLPHLLDGLDRGLVNVPQARVVIEETLPLTDEVCVQVDTRIAEAARTCAPGPLRRTLRALILTVDAEEAARRAEAARKNRAVWSRQIEDGQALLLARGPAEQIAALQSRIDADARTAKAAAGADDARSLDEHRFDVLCAYGLPGSGSGMGQVEVVIHVPIATALGLSDAPGSLDRYGPISAHTVRQLLPDARLRKACVDAATGRILAVDSRTRPPAQGQLGRALLDLLDQPLDIDDTPEPQHDPSTGLARVVRFRDSQCDGPGCSVPAGCCELDHHVPWPIGPTGFSNLRSRSQRCHHAKHSGWTVTADPDGTSHWTSPAGRTYTVPTRDRPPPQIDTRLLYRPAAA